jgi:hypothetical protein
MTNFAFAFVTVCDKSLYRDRQQKQEHICMCFIVVGISDMLCNKYITTNVN